MREELIGIRELALYQGEPPAAPSGGWGKRGRVCLGFERDMRGRSILRHWERRAPLIVQQALYFDRQLPDMPCVYLLSSGGPQVDGDRFELDFSVGPDAMAHIATGAATKVASMRYNYASTHQRIRLDEGAYLEYLPDPVIPCRHSRYHVITELEVAPTATLFFSEIYLPGRQYHREELFAYDLISLTTTCRRPAADPIYREKQLLQPACYPFRGVGGMSGYTHFANLIVVSPESEVLYQRLHPFVDQQRHISFGLLRMAEGVGFVGRLLGNDTATLKREIRHLCSCVRQQIKGVPLPEEFPWR